MAEQKTNVFSDSLGLACKNGHYSTAEKLLNRGFNVNGRDGKGWTPLMWACFYGWMTIVVLLFSRGADVNMQDNIGWSVLMFASQNGHSDVVKMLIDKGAEVNMQNNDGWSALMLASQNGRSDVVKMLIDNGAEVNMQNFKGFSALMHASQNGHSDVAKMLIDKGTDVNMQDNIGFSALMHASQNGHSDVVKMLIDKGAEVNMQNNDGWSALMLASQNERSDIAKMLIDNGAEVNMQNFKGFFALMHASQNGHSDVAKMLIDKGAEVNMQNNDGWSALMLASQSGRSDVVKMLIDNGAKVNMQYNNGWSALMFASQNEHSDIAKMLIDKGAEVNMVSNDNVTALIVASFYRRKEVVQVLLDHHADTSIRDTNGKTALIVACEKGHDEIVDLLLSSVPVDGSASTRCVVSASPTVETDVTSDNTHESPSPGLPTITVTSSSGHPDQHDHVTTPVNIEEDPLKCDTSKTQTDLPVDIDTSNIEESLPSLQDSRPKMSLRSLYKELKTLTDPIKLGVGLGVAQHHLEIIRMNHPQDIEQQKHEVFLFMAKNSMTLEITWEKIADTLEHFMSMGNLAHNIRTKLNLQPSLAEGELTTATMECSNVECISHDMVVFMDKHIGNGAFGAVFRGEVNGQPCAIKVLHLLATEIRLKTALSNTTDTSERFRKECEFLESFDHPNIVRHLATRQHLRTHQFVLALELMDCNLRHYFTPQPDKEPVKLPFPVQSSLCRDIASALEYIHSRGVVHRDLCGENILLYCRGESPIAKVCDFGMSKITKSDTQSVS